MADVCLLTICPGEVRLETCMSLVIAAQSVKPKCDILGLPSGPYIDVSRNQLLATALKHSNAPWFVWIDGDVSFTIADIIAVTDSVEHPITCGWYNSILEDASGAAGLRPVLFDFNVHGFTPIDPTELHAAAADKRRRRERIEVDGCGAGFLALHRDLVLEMGNTYREPAPWFDEPVLGGKAVGEDFGFCLRARQLGWPIWVRPDVHVDHYKTMKL